MGCGLYPDFQEGWPSSCRDYFLKKSTTEAAVKPAGNILLYQRNRGYTELTSARHQRDGDSPREVKGLEVGLRGRKEGTGSQGSRRQSQGEAVEAA